MENITAATSPNRAEMVTKPTARTSNERERTQELTNQTQLATPGTAVDVTARQVPGVKPEKDEVETQIPPSQQSNWRAAEIARAQKKPARGVDELSSDGLSQFKSAESQLKDDTQITASVTREKPATVTEPNKAQLQNVQQMQKENLTLDKGMIGKLERGEGAAEVSSSIPSLKEFETAENQLKAASKITAAEDKQATLTEPVKAHLQNVQQMQAQKLNEAPNQQDEPSQPLGQGAADVTSSIERVNPETPERQLKAESSIAAMGEKPAKATEPVKAYVQNLEQVQTQALSTELKEQQPAQVNENIPSVQPTNPKTQLDAQTGGFVAAAPHLENESVWKSYNEERDLAALDISKEESRVPPVGISTPTNSTTATGNSASSSDSVQIDRSKLTLEQDRTLTMSQIEQRQEAERINYVQELQGMNSGITTMQATMTGLL